MGVQTPIPLLVSNSIIPGEDSQGTSSLDGMYGGDSLNEGESEIMLMIVIMKKTRDVRLMAFTLIKAGLGLILIIKVTVIKLPFQPIKGVVK